MNANYKRVPEIIPWLFVNFTTLKITQMQKLITIKLAQTIIKRSKIIMWYMIKFYCGGGGGVGTRHF